MSDNLIGATTAIFIVSLSIAVNEPVDVAWSTRDGTAKAGTDYQAANGVVTFLPGETEKQIEVIVYGQNVSPTSDKNFFINLMPPTNAVLGTALIEAVIKVEDEAGVPVTSVIVAQGKRGLKGDPGLSAYEQAVLMGYQGTLEDWMQEQADAAAAAQRAGDYAANAAAAATKAENAATAASFLGNIFPTPEAGVDPVTGVGNGAYYNVRSPDDDSYLVEYQNIGGVPTPTGKSYPTAAFIGNQFELINADIDQTKIGNANVWDDANKPYPEGAIVLLNDGTEVISIIPNNNVNPNVSMDGWRRKSSLIHAKSQVFLEDYALDGDLTPVFDELIENLTDGALITFPANKTVYGHFISPNKSFRVDLNGSTLVNTVNDKPLIQIGPLSATEYAVTETVLNHLDTQFTVVGASALFKVGDIGYLWDSATRSITGNVNYEAIKIKAITGDVITVEGFLASYKGAGPIKFYHSAAQLKNASFFNGKLSPTNTHTALVGAIFNVENPDVHKIETFGTTGVAVAIRYCYGANVKDIKPNKAAAVASGQGYGLQILATSNFSVSNVNGLSMRHVYDQDSVYFGDIKNLSDDDDKSACVGLAHNGFAGYITLDGVRTTTSAYPVVLSEQGYGGTVPAEKGKHPFRFIKIKNVNATIREDVTVNTNSVFGVYFQNSIVGCDVDGVDITFKNPEPLTETGQSVAVRVNGIIDKTCNIKNITATSIARFLFTNSQDRGSLTYNSGQVVLRNLNAKDCRYVYHMQGFANVNLDDVNITNNILSNEIGLMEIKGSDVPFAAWHGEKIYHKNTGVAQLNCNTALPIQGKLPLGYKTANISAAVSADGSITNNVLQEKSSFLQLDSGVGTATITLNETTALPKPATFGDELFITVLPNRNTVSFPAGNNIRAAFTVAPNEVVKLRVLSSKWTVVSRNSAS